MAWRRSALVESTEYDLVILDVMLPGLNAWKLQQAIRQKGDTPLLFLTTPGGIEDRLRGWNCMRMTTCSSRLRPRRWWRG